MMRFFTYFGHKHGTFGLYPRPTYGTVIEPFAGSAGYATCNFDRAVRLIERNPEIAAVWDFLIKAKASEIRSIPILEFGKTIDTLKVPTEARNLVGLWISPGGSSGSIAKRHTGWARKPNGEFADLTWNEHVRGRIAVQVDQIRHWQIHCGDYSAAPNIKATWFIDPPYQVHGQCYKFGSALMNFKHLGDWCRLRHGQTIVCENMGADWLPFRFLRRTKTRLPKDAKKGNLEAIYIQNT